MSLISIRFSIFLTEYDYQSYYAVSALLVSFKYEASTHNGVIFEFFIFETLRDVGGD